MTASEFAFLALGLLLGLAVGAALIVVIRSRPSSGAEVRVVVERDSVPRRATTLAGSAFLDPAGPARGGPADRRVLDRDSDEEDVAALDPPAIRTPSLIDLRPTAAIPPAMATDGPPTADRPAPLRLAPLPARAISIDREPDPQLAALRDVAPPSVAALATAAAWPVLARSGARDGGGDPGRTRAPAALGSATPSESAGSTGANGSREPNEATESTRPTPPEPDHAGMGAVPATAVAEPATPETGPCADLRRVADERCAVAVRGREQAAVAADALRSAQRQYDDHHDRAEQADQLADPRAIRSAKDQAQRRFRRERDSATGRDSVEAAARTWLAEINRINNQARDATASATSARAAANQLVVTLERLTVEADAARIKAEAADEACVAARQAAADCDEAAQRERAARHPLEPSLEPAALAVATTSSGVAERDRLGLGTAEPLEDVDAAANQTATDAPILRILRGDRPVMAGVAAEMAGDDIAARRHWQLALADLVDAIIARAIEASALEFPTDDPFWGPFTRDQCRDIVGALASLGFRFDGLGGFVDDRVPTQRDLSMAVGFAGLDPMRIRHWPNEQEMVGLLDRVTVSADEYLAAAAGGLSLGELVSLLGRRADALTEVWNAWGRLRPLLLEPE